MESVMIPNSLTRALRRVLALPATVTLALLLAIVSLGIAPATAQTSPLTCEPLASGTPSATPAADVSLPEVTVPDGATKVAVGYMPLSIYAPIYVAYAKGYYADQGLDVELQSFTNGTDMTVLTSTNQLQVGLTGVGPAFWNAIDQGLPLKVIAPGHAEGSPVASPLMISKKACEDGSITSVADLEGKRVSVNAPGGTEFWLDAALRTAGLTIEDVDLQFLTFPDAVTALDAGALDAAIVGEPIATQAEQQGLAVRLLPDFPVQNIQPTMVFANQGWLDENPEAAAGFVAAYLQASRDLMETPNDPLNLAIINAYTDVPVELVAESVKPVYAEDGHIDLDSLNQLQTFFGDRGLLDYDDPIDPATIVDTQYVDAALTIIDGQ
jgi:NitT/TauT family transport system substrate-binding protein